ncbi:MAG TPA: agmatine deiminase [Desulfuromonas sp.]|nr:agmatine deiminase [Desulfuromonas sp.]
MTPRLPAEWEEQDAILLSWPHGDSDWCDDLPLVEPVFAAIAAAASRFQRVLIVAPEAGTILAQIEQVGGNRAQIAFLPLPTNDTWSRDFGPITVFEGGKPVLLDFGFNGWGLKFAANYDNLVSRRLHRAGCFGSTPLRTVGLTLEGGSLESDGDGTLLTTAECLLGPNRNPHLTREQLELELRRLLGSQRILWLEHGYLAGDDTDAHIDTLARLCPGDTITYVHCDDKVDEHFDALRRMEQELQTFRTHKGKPYRLLPLPWPAPCYGDAGERLPATYANFLVINGAVLVPTYGVAQDPAALTVIASAFPERAIIAIDCRPLIRQHGSLHCVTMHLPKGVLA